MTPEASPITITTGNIDNVIRSIKAEIKEANKGMKTESYFFVMPAAIRGEIDRERYRGRGRPRFSDYHYIPFPDYLPTKMLGAFNT